MSKGALFWANARGKLGETVFYRAGGEQRNRTYLKKIKNPKTIAQAEQRLSMLNFSAGFRLLAPILRYSFPNRASNLSGFNAFVKANKNIDTPVIDRQIAEKGLAVLGQMTIAQGNLVVGNGLQLYRDATSFEDEESPYTGDLLGYELDFSSLDLSDGSPYAIAYDNMVGALGTAPGANIIFGSQLQGLFTLLGLSAGATITFVHGTYEDDGYSYEYRTLSGSSATFSSPFGVNLVIQSVSGTDPLEDRPARIYFGLDVERANDASDFYSIIIADKVNGKLDVTTARFVTTSSDLELVTQFQRGGSVYEQVMTAYSPSQGSVLEGGQS